MLRQEVVLPVPPLWLAKAVHRALREAGTGSLGSCFFIPLFLLRARVRCQEPLLSSCAAAQFRTRHKGPESQHSLPQALPDSNGRDANDLYGEVPRSQLTSLYLTD